MRKTTLIAGVSVISLLIAVAAVFGYLALGFIHSAPGSDSAQVIYELKPGQGFNMVAKDLETQGLIKNAFAFSMYARFTNQRSQIKRGEYGLARNMTPSEVLAVITSGKSISKPFTVAEGLNIFEIADLYEKEQFGKKEEFLRVARDPAIIKKLLGEAAPSLEGYLFPETYMITKFDSTENLVEAMVRRFFSVYESLGVSQALPTWTRAQIVTLASIIEKETGAKEDRPLIASVFHNRLEKKMKLQTDPTILYGIADQTGVLPNNIRKDDILKPTRFNTYVIPGLPPGPISNPGREALLATIKPAKSLYLYFVSRNDGTTVFSESLDFHNKAVKKFQIDPKARNGKSWRDLNKAHKTK
jgi:UPF0755 protein